MNFKQTILTALLYSPSEMRATDTDEMLFNFADLNDCESFVLTLRKIGIPFINQYKGASGVSIKLTEVPVVA